jgi:hypothetical protein
LNYLEDDNNYTLLPRFFALVTLSIEGKPPITLQVTNNVFYVNRPLYRKYDLKGASVGRYVPDDPIMLQPGHPKVKIKKSTCFFFFRFFFATLTASNSLASSRLVVKFPQYVLLLLLLLSHI